MCFWWVGPLRRLKPAEHTVQNPSPKQWHKLFVLAVQCSYWGENNPDMKYAIQLPMNELGLCDGVTAHGAAHKPLWVVSGRGLAEPPCPLSKSTVTLLGGEDTSACGSKTRANSHLTPANSCEEASPDVLRKESRPCSREKAPLSLFSPREMCCSQDGHTTDTWRSHRIRAVVSL